jgi:hypothetical protein
MNNDFVVKKFSSSSPAAGVADGEWSSRTGAQEWLYLALDGIGTVRNISSAYVSGATIAMTSAKIVSIIAGGFLPILQIAGGVIALGSSVLHAFPNACKEYSGARDEYAALTANAQSPLAIQRAKEGLIVAKLGLVNQCLGMVGAAGLTSNGIVTLMSFVGTQIASAAAPATGAIIGAGYAARGAVILGRVVYNYRYLDQFENDLKKILKTKGENLNQTLDSAIKMIQSFDSQPNALKRRIGERDLVLQNNATLDQKISYLERVHQGIHEKKLQQKVSGIIGAAMLFGGLASIAIAIMVFLSTGGLAIPIIGLFSSIFFMAMESIFITYDSSWIFEKVKQKCYKPSQEIEALKERIKLQEIKERTKLQEIKTVAKETTLIQRLLSLTNINSYRVGVA